MQYIVQLIICLHLLAPMAASAQAARIKDPMNYTLAQYGFILAISLLGGVASWYGKVKKGELAASSLMSLVGELTTSALAGLLTFYLCESMDINALVTAATVGVAGHMGAKVITLAEGFVQRYIEKKD